MPGRPSTVTYQGSKCVSKGSTRRQAQQDINVPLKRCQRSLRKSRRVKTSLSSIPFFDIPPNQKFSGREEILEPMQSQLIGENDQPLKGASVLVYGLGGMGKSSIAVKYIYDNYTKYEPYIFWIASDTRQKLSAAILKACQQLRLPLENSDADLAKAPRFWRRWLDSGTIIVTSRRRDVGSQLVLHEHEVAAMSSTRSRTLLLNLLSPPLRDQGNHDLPTVDKICGFLDGMPLATATETTTSIRWTVPPSASPWTGLQRSFTSRGSIANVDYYTANFESLSLQNPEHHIRFRQYVRNIVNWGAGVRLQGIRQALDQLQEESKKAASRAAKSRPPPTAASGRTKHRAVPSDLSEED
ncbi:hypothetical protein ACJZ2D_007954 [Fusarium nematophilum]